MSRSVSKSFTAVETKEGKGAIVFRTIGTDAIPDFDPFLLLDEFTSGPGAGFPDHPHRGFETVSYLLTGSIEHEDCLGNRGVIGPGEVQWMTAGRGILHSEVPRGKEQCRAIQLWVNLKRADKMQPPSYQDLRKDHIPEVSHDGVMVRVIAGSALGATAKVLTRTPAIYLDFTLAPGARLDQPVDPEWNSLVYLLEGGATFGTEDRPFEGVARQLLLFTRDGAHVSAQNHTGKPCRFLLIAGQPIGEPVVRGGPFVLNTKEELRQTFDDYHQYQNGFEKARGWKSVAAREGY